MTTFVIVGGGLAGAKAAEGLRAEGFDGDIVLFGSEQENPYERPPLAKGYLLGKDTRDSVFVHAAGWYPEHNIDLRTGMAVTAIDPARHTVTFDGGTQPYDKLLLSTGASARRHRHPGGRPRRRVLPADPAGVRRAQGRVRPGRAGGDRRRRLDRT